MTNLIKLEESVRRMIEGERKRREVALKFVEQAKEILVEVAPDLWGTGESYEFEYTTWVTRIKDGKKQPTSIYFRWEEHRVAGDTEEEGFYSSIEYPVWGDALEDMKGSDFWYAIQVILEWLPIITKQMDRKTEGREKLLALIK